jgi:hypothetical protein
VRVANKPQMLVNLIAIAISGAGLVKAIGWPKIRNRL